MNIMFAGIFGGWEIVLILAVVLLLFGSKKLPELAKGLGQGIKEFKKATRDVTDEMHNAMNDDSHTPAPRPPMQRTLPPSTPTTVEVEHTVPQSTPSQKV